MMTSIVDGVFVGSAWHQYVLKQQGWPDEKVFLSGYPIDITKPIETDIERTSMVFAPKELTDFSFLLDVIEAVGIKWPFAERECDLEHIHFLIPKIIPRTDLQDEVWFNRAVRLESSLPTGISIERYDIEKEEEAKKATIMLSTKVLNSFDPLVANAIMSGQHPVVPDQGCYLEMMRVDLSGERYIYEQRNINSCVDAILRGLEQPSPPKKYIETYGTAFDQMAKVMLGEEDDP